MSTSIPHGIMDDYENQFKKTLFTQSKIACIAHDSQDFRFLKAKFHPTKSDRVFTIGVQSSPDDHSIFEYFNRYAAASLT